MPQTIQQDSGRGLWYGIAAYGIWGVFPLFWPLLEPSAADDIVANRMVWSLIAVVGMLAAQRHWGWIRPLLRQPRRLAMLAGAAAVISVNWGVYIWAVNAGHVVETSLGYFINPLVTIGFGVLVLKERLRAAQWTAVGIGAVAVAVLTVAFGQLPWIALILALSFATYGLLKKQVGLSGLESLAAESAFMFPFALGYLVYLEVTGHGTFGHTVPGSYGWGHSALLMLGGVITAIPLLFFGAAAVRVPLTTLGLLQYLAPIFQFLCGVLWFHESMPPARWAGFALVWAALAVLTWDALRQMRVDRAGRAAAAARSAQPVAAAQPLQPEAAEAGVTR
ncbi:EamA family transporter RarD [Streptomyces rubellomurinus]|uniref:Protein rarD n=2 Tax=Streptomyces TaxID=1883 RepID=A0A0F2TEH3_STRR3|nr:EamA family transporter RarD [Streptomyces rubellomurinus]KJS55916.1 protein rarD [Streptomyces rubellomurinus subsp. indigoferus]KJS61573.1 protein rarD [Streptomyces rubellomurinus]